MLYSTTIHISNASVTEGSRQILLHISSALGINPKNIIRWAVVATHQEQSTVIVSYVRE